MLQPEHVEEHAEPAAHGASEAFNAGETIIGHVANSSIDHPLIHLPTIGGIDFSVTKQVFMLWVVAAVVLAFLWFAGRRLKAKGGASTVPTGAGNFLEFVIEFVRDSISAPNVGAKWVDTYTPLLLTFGAFILVANVIGLIPIFDVLALLNHTVLHLPEDSFLVQVTHGGSTATGNFNVTAALATISFFAIIVAGVRAHGFFGHWKNLVPHGVPKAIVPFLIVIEIMGMFVRPFALTMRLAANMAGGHIAILALLSFVFIFAELYGGMAGVGIGALFSLPMAVGISLLEIIVVGVQAYVFTLLTATFIGMAIHAHH
jgi:F-type H+-transporting ATPase subunit a